MSRDNIGFARIIAMLRQRSGFHVIAIRDHNRTVAQRFVYLIIRQVVARDANN